MSGLRNYAEFMWCAVINSIFQWWNQELSKVNHDCNHKRIFRLGGVVKLFETHYLNINPKHYIAGKLIWYVTCDWWLIKMAVIYASIGSICMNPNHRNTHIFLPLQWHHNGGDGVSNHQPHDCLLNRLFRRRSKKTSMVVTGLCAGKSPVTGEFPAQRASNAENYSIWWRHHASRQTLLMYEQAMKSRCRFHRRQTDSMPSATTMLYCMRTRISDCTPRYSVGCYYISMPEIPVPGA